ncbi:Spindle and kinetochore-associated protein 1 homolog [Coccomyxa sp. Obi]|nr:Spindle and kinetochore-associated protein 1 homolog [Coccomyxa sp. Obi]
MVEAFTGKLSELKAITLLRLEESSIDLFRQDVTDLEDTVRSLEQNLRKIQSYIAQERQALPKVEAVVEACSAQHEQLMFMSHHLPAFLPGGSTAPAVTSSVAPIHASPPDESDHPAANDENVPSNPRSRPNSADMPGEKKKRAPAPRRFVMNDELSSLSAYMTARLSLEKVNAAVDDAATMAEGVARMLATARGRGKMATHDRKRAQMLMVNVAGKEGVKGHYWFMEADMKNASILRPDKTGKSLLTVLRHLGRLHEVRLSVEGSMQPVYVLQ